jgi:pimeloyl-ACP methyl ester carboxylesterase
VNGLVRPGSTKTHCIWIGRANVLAYMRMHVLAILSFAAFVGTASGQAPAVWRDPSPHKERFVDVGAGVRLEVLDWGGRGRPLLLLAGGGNTAHVFDDFAPKLTLRNHVYGITRRGFGRSGFSETSTASDRLRDDVIAVISALKLDRPVLVGHSFGGFELSAVASARPDRIAGLVYLESAYPYAISLPGGASIQDVFNNQPPPPTPGPSDLESFDSLRRWDARAFGFHMPESEFRQTWETDAMGRPRRPRDFSRAQLQLLMPVVMNGTRYSRIPAPALIVFASPHVVDGWVSDLAPERRGGVEAYFNAVNAATEKQAKALEEALPDTRVVRLRSSHYVFISSEPEILREMRTFLDRVK